MSTRMKFSDNEVFILSKILGRLSHTINPGIPEKEARMLIAEFLLQNALDIDNVNELGILLLTSLFEPDPMHLH